MFLGILDADIAVKYVKRLFYFWEGGKGHWPVISLVPKVS